MSEYAIPYLFQPFPEVRVPDRHFFMQRLRLLFPIAGTKSGLSRLGPDMVADARDGHKFAPRTRRDAPRARRDAPRTRREMLLTHALSLCGKYKK